MLLINGSSRKSKTTYQFAKSFCEYNPNRCEILWVHDYLDDIKGLADKILEADTVGIFAPLYVDTLPAAVIELLEGLSHYPVCLQDKKMFCFGQSGFPDVTRMVPLEEVCRCFAEEMNMQWMGSIAYGGGAIIDGKPLFELGNKGKKLLKGLKKASEDIVFGNQISDEAKAYFKSDIPVASYPLLAMYLNHSAKKQGKKNSVDIYSRYYAEL